MCVLPLLLLQNLPIMDTELCSGRVSLGSKRWQLTPSQSLCMVRTVITCSLIPTWQHLAPTDSLCAVGTVMWLSNVIGVIAVWRAPCEGCAGLIAVCCRHGDDDMVGVRGADGQLV